MNLRTLAGQTVYLDDTKLGDTVDKNYFISTLRQQLLANGCELRDKREDADFIVEARAGAIGTDRNDLLFGIPSMNVPQIPIMQPVPAAIPEIPIAKRKDQRGIAKVAVFAYHRATGTPVWQSGIVREESSANDVWIFGAGPFQRGTIYDGTEFAGAAIKREPSSDDEEPSRTPAASVADEKLFNSPKRLAKQTPTAPSQNVVLAAHQETGAPATKSAAAPPSPVPAPAAKRLPPPDTAAAPGSTSPSNLATPGVGATRTTSSAAMPASATNDIAQNAAAPPGSASPYSKAAGMSALPQPRFNSPR